MVGAYVVPAGISTPNVRQLFKSIHKKNRATRRPPGCNYFTGSDYLTNTEIVPLTVWPPGPYAVKVYTEFVIGFTVRLPLGCRVCGPSSLPIRTTDVAF